MKEGKLITLTGQRPLEGEISVLEFRQNKYSSLLEGACDGGNFGHMFSQSNEVRVGKSTIK